MYFLGLLISCTSSINIYDCRTILEFETKDSKGVIFKIGHEYEYEYEWIDFYKRTGREKLFSYDYNYKKIVKVILRLEIILIGILT